jgi:hypothetical protein
MTSPGAGAPPVPLAAARVTLADLAARIGTAGLAAAATRPGLAAAVDQHAAALWDLLGDDDQTPTEIGLAGYADGLRDMASGLGWHLPQPRSVDWDTAPWLVVRLVAVCQVAAALPGT